MLQGQVEWQVAGKISLLLQLPPLPLGADRL